MIKAYNARNEQLIGGWETTTAAEQATGTCRSSICKALKGRLHTAGGYKWRESPDWTKMDIKKATYGELVVAYESLQRDIDPFLDNGCYGSLVLDELRQTQKRIAKEIVLRKALEGLN